MKPTKEAVAFVVYDKDRSKVLVVQRPEEDELFPNTWSLPSGYLKKGEFFKEAVLRVGRDKLGIGLKIVRLIGEDTLERDDYFLHMREYEARIVSGEPKAPQLIKGITQYKSLAWESFRILRKPARKGALCSQIFLTSLGRKW